MRTAKATPPNRHPTHGDPDVAEGAAELLGALAHPVRLRLVDALSDGTRCVHELVDTLGVSQPLVSQHLRVLRGARLVAGQRRGREIAYSLVDDHVAHIVGDAIRHTEEGLGPKEHR
jgi:DNA-binding transcriptional ArsR family regulator